MCITSGLEPCTSGIVNSISTAKPLALWYWCFNIDINGICLFFVIAGRTWWLVPDVRRRTRRASHSGHDIAGSGPGLQTDLPAAEARSFACW